MTAFSRRHRNAEEAHYQRLLDKAPSIIWKRFADGVSLKVRMFAPPEHHAGEKAPAVMFFSGGMWALSGSAEFVAWAIHLTRRGIVCFIPEYRTHARYDVTPEDIIQDGLDAWKWLHHNAENLGLDAERITIAGTDAGGLMALNCGMQPLVFEKRWWHFKKEDELPLQPACIAILRGVIDPEAPEAKALQISKKGGMNVGSFNPCALLRRKLPLLFCAHGMQDPLLDYEMRQWFCDEWERFGNTAELVLCPFGDHTLPQFSVNPAVFEQVLLSWDAFMVEQGLWPESDHTQDAMMV